MTIKNYQQLASSPLRKTALAMIEAGLAALQSEAIIKSSVALSGQSMVIKDHGLDLSRFSRIFVVGFGKAAVGMGRAIESVLGEKITGGLILDRKKGYFAKLISLVGTHPDPSEENLAATREILEHLTGLDAKTLVLVLISGGGSALLTAPYKISVDEKATISRKLMDNGATIDELNTVRKHLSKVKGGQLAKAMYPATVVSLILSDVPGDDLSTIASGPTVRDPSTTAQAAKILKHYGWKNLPELIETPKEEHYFERVTNILLANAATAIEPMGEEAKKSHLTPRLLSTAFAGDADIVGRGMLKKIKPGEAFIATGETTVQVTGKGLGGRNQQVVLSSLSHLQEGQLIASVGTDGHDNSEAAGAVGDLLTLTKAKEHKLDPKVYAKNNDSFTFFKAVGDAVETGELESNFADILVCLWQQS